jgi:hypothetical protein
MSATERPAIEVPQPVFMFDLDGTLVDSVYQHVIAWQEALAECGVLFLNALRRGVAPLPGARELLAAGARACPSPSPPVARGSGPDPHHSFVIGDSVWDR